jgi:hypothetical protein
VIFSRSLCKGNSSSSSDSSLWTAQRDFRTEGVCWRITYLDWGVRLLTYSWWRSGFCEWLYLIPHVVQYPTWGTRLYMGYGCTVLQYTVRMYKAYLLYCTVLTGPTRAYRWCPFHDYNDHGLSFMVTFFYIRYIAHFYNNI